MSGSSSGSMDPLWLAASKLRRDRLDECIAICDDLLSRNHGDQAAWFIKCRAVLKKNYIDDIELDEESMAEALLDENAVAATPRPGTSLNKPQTSSSNSSAMDQGIRPVSQSGRPITGFIRPASSRPMSGSNTSIRDALQSRSRLGTASRPMTTFGREIRLGTASLAGATTGALVDVERLNVKKYAKRTGLAMVITDYLIYVEHNNRKALEICAEATVENDFKNWWWKARLGKCYMKLGMLRDAEKQFRSSLTAQPMISTYLELVNVYLRLDLPNTALDLLQIEACVRFPLEPRLLLGQARIYDQLNESDKSVDIYRKVLELDASHIEAMACVAAHHFYADQPELAIRLYRRLLQQGVNNTELWNNVGLCCFYASQFDMALGCFEKALALATDDTMADVWYNIGHVGVALGDLGLAYQAFKVAASIDPSHGEAINNIAVLEMRRQKLDVARACLSISHDSGAHLFEPRFNLALMHYKQGDFQQAHKYAQEALTIYPKHVDSMELMKNLSKLFETL